MRVVFPFLGNAFGLVGVAILPVGRFPACHSPHSTDSLNQNVGAKGGSMLHLADDTETTRLQRLALTSYAFVSLSVRESTPLVAAPAYFLAYPTGLVHSATVSRLVWLATRLPLVASVERLAEPTVQVRLQLR